MNKRALLLSAFLVLVYSGTVLYRPAEASSFIYLSPRPDSHYVHPETSLAVREGGPFDR
ncbi:MAG TPA: hypothetical protein VMN57_16795 [Anaerolineales bacterium]|nr:hypothetical protein [Anaerolineales bacterium]